MTSIQSFHVAGMVICLAMLPRAGLAQVHHAPHKQASQHKAVHPEYTPEAVAVPTSTSNAELASTINRELIHLDFHWGQARAYRGTEQLVLGLWGQHAPTIFTGSDEALSEATSFYHYRTGSQVLKYVTAAALLTELVYIGKVSGKRELSNTNLGVIYGLLGGGLVTTIISEILNSIAHGHLGRATYAENKSVVDRTLNVQPALSLYVAPVAGQLQAGAVLRF